MSGSGDVDRRERETEEEQRARRSLNLRIKGLAEEEGEDVKAKVSDLFDQLNVDFSEYGDVLVVGRSGRRPEGRRHILLTCPSQDVKEDLLQYDQELQGLGIGVSIIEDQTRRQRQPQAAPQEKPQADEVRSRTVLLDGLMDLRSSQDDDYLVDYFLRNLIRDDAADPGEVAADLKYVKQELRAIKRVGAYRGFGKKPRTLHITFRSQDAKDTVMYYKRNVMNTQYFLNA